MSENIPGYPGYILYPDGRCWSTKTEAYLSVHSDIGSGRKYPYVSLTNNGVTTHISIHRLLALVFLGLPSLDSELEVDHIDTDTNNYCLDNLQVLTPQEHLAKTLKDRGFSSRDKRSCELCERVLSHLNTTNTCKFCKSEKKRNSEPDKAGIETLYHTYGSWVQAAKQLGISDNGLRKRYKALGGDPKSIKTTQR